VALAGQARLEIGWVLRGQFWGQGYATEIGRTGLAFAFDELAAEEVVAYTEARNARSRAVMERLGFRYSHDLFLEEGGERFVLYRLARPSHQFEQGTHLLKFDNRVALPWILPESGRVSS
jgi:RimJ/RimL family protein N-acetyltransferase